MEDDLEAIELKEYIGYDAYNENTLTLEEVKKEKSDAKSDIDENEK